MSAALQAGSPPGPGVVDVSVVVIGRNEGERLSRCLRSVQEADWQGLRHQLFYVDSRSVDDSVQRARRQGADVLMLDDDAPCAAKGRNLGWRRASGRFILFLDGDTVLHPAFVRHALDAMSDPACCAAWGHRRESDPGQSLLTRVLDLDWVYPVGRTLYFGGDVLIRRDALDAVGGFDPTLKAGEEPELGARLRARGWHIRHLDVPMTTHDLGIRSVRAYAVRAYRSGIAYAEVAQRMQRLGDPLWQREARRDFQHGLALAALPALWLAALLLQPGLAGLIAAAAALVLARAARRSAWKAPGHRLLHWQYAVHTYAQKVPALFGQLAWRRARRAGGALHLVEYRERPARPGIDGRTLLKRALTALLVPLAGAWRRGVVEAGQRTWAAARLSESIGRGIDPSNIILGTIDVIGTRRVSVGRGALIYPGVVLETQGDGRIEIGDDVVLSRGVHIVAFERVTLGGGTLVGEYTSIRDANHRRCPTSVRHSGHDQAAIDIGRNVWIGRGATVLKGTCLGDSSVVGANAVVTRSVAPHACVAGAPARPIRSCRPPTHPGARTNAGSLQRPDPAPEHP